MSTEPQQQAPTGQKPGRVVLDHKCTECKVQAVFEMGPYAKEFGTIYSTDGLRAFLVSGLCEFCGDVLADFAVMSTREGW